MRYVLSTFVLPLITLAVILGAWFFAVRVGEVPSYLMPAPEAVLEALRRGYIEGLFWQHFLFTLQSTTTGYVVGCALAIVCGAIVAESEVIERMVFPYIIALQAMPKVALAPLIIVWFGFGLESKIVLVALICFFPLFVNTVTGLRQTNPALIDLMRAFSASPLRIFWKIKLPSAAGHIFAGLQISVVMSLIGAVVAEFVASTKGLGYLINAATVNLDTATMFASLISLAFMGIAGSMIVRFLHRRLVFWDRNTGAVAATE